jgi:hypothetical protein
MHDLPLSVIEFCEQVTGLLIKGGTPSGDEKRELVKRLDAVMISGGLSPKRLTTHRADEESIKLFKCPRCRDTGSYITLHHGKNLVHPCTCLNCQ